MTVRPALLPAALLALGLALGLSGCAGTKAPEASASSGSSSSGPTDAAERSAAGRRIEVQLGGGKVTGDTGRITVAAGTHVTLAITSDVADEAHLHGYDEEAELTPGKPAEITFEATIPGVFEVELHEAGTVLLTLQVQ